MSLKTWKEAHYPRPARDFREVGSVAEAVGHSIKKWEGYLPENLSLHKVWMSPAFMGGLTTLTSPMIFDVGGAQGCALCQHCRNNCAVCPVKAVDAQCGQRGSAYSKVMDAYHGTHPESAEYVAALHGMIDVLRKAQSLVEVKDV